MGWIPAVQSSVSSGHIACCISQRLSTLALRYKTNVPELGRVRKWDWRNRGRNSSVRGGSRIAGARWVDVLESEMLPGQSRKAVKHVFNTQDTCRGWGGREENPESHPPVAGDVLIKPALGMRTCASPSWEPSSDQGSSLRAPDSLSQHFTLKVQSISLH